MPYSPFTCHQEFLWVDYGEKFSMLCKYLHNIQTQHNPDPTIILAQNLSLVRCITQFLLDNHYPTAYYHEGHTEEQLAKAKDNFYSRRKPILVLSLEAHFKQFVQSARFVLVWDFPTSIAHYQQDCKTMVNFKDKHSLITSFITNYHKYLLPDLHDYIIQKGEQVPPWLSHKLVQKPPSVKFHGSVDSIQHSQGPVKPNASRLSRPYLGKEEYAHHYVKPHSDKVTRSVSSSQLRNAHNPSSYHDQVTTRNGVPPPKSKSYQSHAVTVDIATSQPPGYKTLGPNSSSLHTLSRDDYSKSTTSESSDHKVGSQANQSQPKVKLSDIRVKYDITHSHDLLVSHSDKHPLPVCSIFPSKPTVTTTTNLSAEDPMYSSLPFMGETHHENPYPCSLNDLYDEVHHVPIQDSSHLHLSIMV